MSKTVVRTPQQLKPFILAELYSRGGLGEIGTSRKPGADRDIYVTVAKAVGVSEEEQRQTIGERCPEIFNSGRTDVEKDARRNAWDYTMLVAVQQLKDPKRAGKKRDLRDAYLHSPQVGVWELTQRGTAAALRVAHGDILTSSDL